MATRNKPTGKLPETTEEILFTNKHIFKDEEEHPYECLCTNGVAYCTKVECEENKKAPQHLLLGYPMMHEIKGTPKEDRCKECRGIPYGEPLQYSDIAMLYGKIGKWGFNAEELNIMDKLAQNAKMGWFYTTTEGNFKDLDTGKEITARRALGQMVDGLVSENFDCLTRDELITLVKALASIM